MNLILTITKSKVRELKESNCWSFNVHTQEIDNEQLNKLRSIDDFCKMFLSDEGINKDQLIAIEETIIDQAATGKSKSELFRLELLNHWQEKSEGHERFKDYYNTKMDGFINHLKTKRQV